MLEIVDKAVQLLPVVVALNVLLSAVGALADAISKAQGKEGQSKVGLVLVKISAVIKKVVDLASANLPHK